MAYSAPFEGHEPPFLVVAQRSEGSAGLAHGGDLGDVERVAVEVLRGPRGVGPGYPTAEAGVAHDGTEGEASFEQLAPASVSKAVAARVARKPSAS